MSNNFFFYLKMDSPKESLIKSPDSPLCASYNPSLPLDLIQDDEIRKIKGDAIGNLIYLKIKNPG